MRLPSGVVHTLHRCRKAPWPSRCSISFLSAKLTIPSQISVTVCRSSAVQGIVYRDGDNIVSTGLRTPIENLDDLPMPAWDLYEIKDYHKISRLLARRRPVTMAEFSRGCVFKCDFCVSKITAMARHRKKSPERCAAEVVRMYELGFREFLLADDIFTSDQKWARQVLRHNCDSVSIWHGVAPTASELKALKTVYLRRCGGPAATGCRLDSGSGNDRVLKMFGKGGRATVEQGRNTVQMARKAGIDTNGFFLLGLSLARERLRLVFVNIHTGLSILGLARPPAGSPPSRGGHYSGPLLRRNRTSARTAVAAPGATSAPREGGRGPREACRGPVGRGRGRCLKRQSLQSGEIRCRPDEPRHSREMHRRPS